MQRAHSRPLRTAAVTACAVLALGAVGTANGADYQHPGVVEEVSQRWVPHVAITTGQPKPLAYTIAEAGDQMVVGGRFHTVENGTRSQSYTRYNVFAFDADDGTINPDFDPTVDDVVWSTVSDGTHVWIGGGFRNVNGQSAVALAKLDLATGELVPGFDPPFRGGRITDMELHDGHLVVSGRFNSKLMSLNPDTGRRTGLIDHSIDGRLPNSDSPQVFKFDISGDGQHLAAVGNFLSVDGAPRPRMFLLDLTAAGSSLSAWNYEPNGLSCSSTRRNAIAYLQDVDFAPDSSWLAVAAFGFMYQTGQRGYQLCDSVARFETDELDPIQPTWINYTGGDSLKSVGVTDRAVYVQGHSRWLDNPFGRDYAGPGAVERLGGGAVDPDSGLALPWNPEMPQQAGGHQILPTADGVWFVTDGIRFGGRYHRGIRFAALP
jgi:hypothetical protein